VSACGLCSLNASLTLCDSSDIWIHFTLRSKLLQSFGLVSNSVKDLLYNFKIIREISTALIESKKHEVLEEAAGRRQAADESGNDILTLIIKHTLSTSVHRFNDIDARENILGFLGAGYETSATALNWIVNTITRNQAIQKRLRDEIVGRLGATGPLNYEGVQSLEYLDAVVRETLRLWPPAPFLFREAVEDTVIPLSKPLPNGDTAIHAPKGTFSVLHVRAMNVSEEYFGPDAEEFRPERWLSKDPNPAWMQLPGLIPGVMAFGNGPHGYDSLHGQTRSMTDRIGADALGTGSVCWRSRSSSRTCCVRSHSSRQRSMR
jgi:cytochrome P450